MYKKDLRTKHYIVKDGEVLGRVWDASTAQKVALIEGAAYCSIYQHLLDLDLDWFEQLYETFVGPLGAHELLPLNEAAKKIWEELENTKIKFIPKPPARDVLRAMYEYHTAYSRSDISKLVPNVKWATIRVAMSQLRREGINIKHTGDGLYVRQ